MDKKAFDSIPEVNFQKLVQFAFCLDSSRRLSRGHGGEDVRHRRPGAGVRTLRQRGLRGSAGALRGRGVTVQQWGGG